jgi:hypothetical protein
MKTITFYNDVLPIDLVGAEVIYPIEMKCFTHFFDRVVKRPTFDNFENEFVCYFRHVVNENLDLFLFLDLTTNKIFGVSTPEVGRSSSPLVMRVKPKEIFQSIVEGFVEYWSGLEDIEIIGFESIDAEDLVVDEPVQDTEDFSEPELTSPNEDGVRDYFAQSPEENRIVVNLSILPKWKMLNESLKTSNIKAIPFTSELRPEPTDFIKIGEGDSWLSVIPVAKDVSLKLLECRLEKGLFTLPTFDDLSVLLEHLRTTGQHAVNFFVGDLVVCAWYQYNGRIFLAELDLVKCRVVNVKEPQNNIARQTEDGTGTYVLFPKFTK